MITQQAIKCAKRQPDAVSVTADDTDVIVLLLHHYQNEGLTVLPAFMFMTSPVQLRSMIGIKATVEKHHAIVPGLLAAHVLSGCDTVPIYFGIGTGRKARRPSLRSSPPVHKVHGVLKSSVLIVHEIISSNFHLVVVLQSFHLFNIFFNK